jgi:hypothetical protein
MAWLPIALLISVIWISGCSTDKGVRSKKTATMMDVYAKSIGQAQRDASQFVENKLKEQNTFGFVKPYIPVVNQPEVRKVWIPAHKSEDNPQVMIAGHWVYVMIRPSSWFIDNNLTETRIPLIPVSSSINSPFKNAEKTHADQYPTIRENI